MRQAAFYGIILVMLAGLMPGCILESCLDRPWGTAVQWDQEGLYEKLPNQTGDYGGYFVTHHAGPDINRPWKTATATRGDVEVTLVAKENSTGKDNSFTITSPDKLANEQAWFHLNQTFSDLQLGTPAVENWDVKWGKDPC